MRNYKWKYYDPTFEYKEGITDLSKPWNGGNFFENGWELYPSVYEYKESFNDYNLPWTGHTFFAYDLVRNFKPKTIVELGTFKGTSLYSMSQAVKDAALDTELFAVDLWEGEEQTGYYGEEVYDFVLKIIRTHYSGQNVRLLRKTFDEASVEFEKDSIDLLHIDGLHTYEAVKQDYETWKEKVTKNGVIMFHDINVADFGVWKVWEQAKKDNKEARIIEFKHNYGLGVIIRDERIKEMITKESVESLVQIYKFKALGILKAEEIKALSKKLNELKNKLSFLEEKVEQKQKPLINKLLKK